MFVDLLAKCMDKITTKLRNVPCNITAVTSCASSVTRAFVWCLFVTFFAF